MIDCTFPLLSHFPTLTAPNPEKKKVESHKGLVTGKGEASDKQTRMAQLCRKTFFLPKKRISGEHRKARRSRSTVLHYAACKLVWRWFNLKKLKKKNKSFALFTLQYTAEVSILFRSLSLRLRVISSAINLQESIDQSALFCFTTSVIFFLIFSDISLSLCRTG